MRRGALGRDTITILRAPLERDGHGNDKRNWSAAAETPVTGCDAQPVGSQETLVNEDQVLLSYKVYAPAGTDVVATDRVSYGGTTYDVFGEPERWRSRSGRLDYVLVTLVNWRGKVSA